MTSLPQEAVEFEAMNVRAAGDPRVGVDDENFQGVGLGRLLDR
jgi:hypothetical protein